MAALTQYKGFNPRVFDDYLTAQQSRLPYLADVTQVTPRVIRILGGNPGKVSRLYVIRFRTQRY